MRHKIVTAFFPRRSELASALARLIERGTPLDAISVLPKTVNHLDDIGLRAANRAAEGAAIGALIAASCGALLGFAGAGSIVIPQASAVLAGPLVAALAGAGAAGTVGAIAGALLGARVPVYVAEYLDDALERGGALLAVRCAPERAGGVEEILLAGGAQRLRSAWARQAVRDERA